MRATRAAFIIGLALALGGCASTPPLAGDEARRDRLLETSDRAQRALNRGDLRHAAALYREVLRLAESIEDFPGVAVAALNLAATYQALDEPALAHGALDKILRTPERFARHRVAEAAGRKALLALQAGELDAAASWLARADSHCAPPACRIRTALANLRAHLLLEQGAAGEARFALAQSLAASRSEGDREEEANALRLDGRAASRLGEHDQAMARLAEALEIDKQLALPRKIAVDLLALAEAELARGDRGVARDYAQRALAVAQAARSRSAQDAAKRLLGRIP